MMIRSRSAYIFVFLTIVAGGTYLIIRNQSTPQLMPQTIIKKPVVRQKRSVLLVTLDTTRADRLEPYGADNVATPTMSKLAAQGIVFERAWAVAPITLVAHTSILSGLYPFEHGVRNNGIQYVPDSVTTLAERLRKEDYRTAAFVSAAVLERRYGLDQGFEVYDDNLSSRRNVSSRMVADRPAENTVAAASAWLDRVPKDEKFFIWVHFYDPHASYSPPPPYRDQYRDRLYEGEIAYMDNQLGRLLQHPRLRSTIKEAPVVMVIGDHGESLGEHGERTHAILAYDSTLHVPWLLRVPGGPAGVRIREPVGQVDLMPTVLSLLGLTASEPALSGRDLTPLLEGHGHETLRPYYSETFLPFYTYGWAKLRVLHRGRWKLIDAPERELYNRIRDPLELTNLHALESGMAHDMKRDLDEWLDQYDTDHETSLELNSEALSRLRGLGYLAVGSGQTEDHRERPNPMEMISQHVGLERARTFLSDHLYKQAIQQLEVVLTHDPMNLAALLDLVHAHKGLGHIEKAIGLAERALQQDPEYTQTYLILARLEAQQGRTERALELANLAVERDSSNPNVQIHKVTLLNRLGRQQEVDKALTKILANHPKHPRTNAIYAYLVESRQGKVQKAEQRLRRALERDPFLSQGWFFLGKLLTQQQRFEEAEASYQTGLTKQPDSSDLHGALGHLLARLGRQVEAVGQLREAIRLSPQQRSEFHVSLGAVLAEMGRLEEAQREYDKVLALKPSHPGARNNAAIALYRKGQVTQANIELGKIIAEFPKHADAYNNLSAIAVDQQLWQKAITLSRQTLVLKPNLVEAWNNLGIGLEETGEIAEATAAYQKALKLDSAYWQAQFNLGTLLSKTGQAVAAARAFETVLMQVPSHAESHLALGDLYAGSLAVSTRAQTHWNAFLRYSPTHPKREEILRRLTEL